MFFIFHHVNRVLELPAHLKVILANMGWAQERESLDRLDPGRLAEKLDHEEVEAESATEQNKWTDTAMELMARRNFELLKS